MRPRNFSGQNYSYPGLLQGSQKHGEPVPCKIDWDGSTHYIWEFSPEERLRVYDGSDIEMLVRPSSIPGSDVMGPLISLRVSATVPVQNDKHEPAAASVIVKEPGRVSRTVARLDRMMASTRPGKLYLYIFSVTFIVVFIVGMVIFMIPEILSGKILSK